MLSKYELLTYALKGVEADIEKLESKIKKGKNKLKDIEAGNKEKKQESNYYAIQEKVKNLLEEVENLQKLSDDLKWQISEYEE